jgi:hypothetical protein
MKGLARAPSAAGVRVVYRGLFACRRLTIKHQAVEKPKKAR